MMLVSVLILLLLVLHLRAMFPERRMRREIDKLLERTQRQLDEAERWLGKTNHRS